MPSITINRKTVEKILGKKIDDDILKDRVPYMGISIEDLSDKEMHVEVDPNRPDLLSDQGFARAFASFISEKTGLIKYEVNKSNFKVIVDKSVDKVRPYTACAVVKNLNFDDEKIKEIIKIQEKLHITFGRNRKRVAIGVYPLEKISFPVSYLAKKPEDIKFRPLESPKEMTGLQVLSRHPTGRDYGHLLEGEKVFPIFIDSENKILSMPPIINSHDVGKISESTKEVFVECSGFDYEVLAKCLNMIVCALSDMGGKIYEIEIDKKSEGKKKSPNLNPEEMKFDLEYVNKRLGLDLKDKDVKRLLEKMGYEYKDSKAFIPSYRADVLHPIDLVEDIAIAYGYDNFEEIIPQVATVGKEDNFEVFKRHITEILTGLGLIECKTYHITNKKVQCDMMNCDIETVDLANALTADYNVLNAWIIPHLMHIFRNNKHHEYPQKIFSIGSIFKKIKKDKKDNSKNNLEQLEKEISDSGIVENDRLACALCSEKSDYTAIRQIVDYLFSMIDIDYEVFETEHSSFIPGRVGRINVEGKDVCYIGEISPLVLDNFELDFPVCAFELNLTELYYLLNNKD